MTRLAGWPASSGEVAHPLTVYAVSPLAHLGNPAHGTAHFRLHRRGNQNGVTRAWNDDDGRPVELHSEVAPEAGQVVNGVGVRDDEEIDPFVGHSALKLCYTVNQNTWHGSSHIL